MDLSMLNAQFPPGTPVRITATAEMPTRSGAPISAETVGVVAEWVPQPTGSWYAHGKKDRLWLPRLKLRKLDGEFTLLVMDDRTSIARLEAAPT